MAASMNSFTKQQLNRFYIGQSIGLSAKGLTEALKFSQLDIQKYTDAFRLLESQAQSSGTTLVKVLDDCKKSGNSVNVTIEEFVRSHPNATADDYAKAMNNVSVATEKASIATRAFSIAANMLLTAGITFAITELINLLITFANVSDNARKHTEAFSNAIKQNSSDLKNYKDRLDDAQSTLRNEKSSLEERTQARKELQLIQKEMLEHYGNEKGAVAEINSLYETSLNPNLNTTTDILNLQAEAWKNLADISYEAAKTEADSAANMAEQLANYVVYGTRSATDAKLKEATNSRVNLDRTINGKFLSFQLSRDKEIEKILLQNGAKQIATSNGEQFFFEGSYQDNLKALQKSKNEIEAIAKLSNKQQDYLDYINEQITDIEKNIEAVQPILKQKIKEDYIDAFDPKVTNGKNFKQYNDNLVNLQEEYNQAIDKNNQALVKKIGNDITETLNNALKDADYVGISGIKDFFTDEYNDWVDNVYSDRLLSNFNDTSFKEKLALSVPDLNYDELLHMSELSDDIRRQAYQEFPELLDQYAALQNIIGNDVPIKQAIDLMREYGIISSESLNKASQYFTNLNEDILRQYSDSDLEALMVDIKIDRDASKADLDKALAELQQKSSENPIELYSSFDGTELGERIQSLNESFESGEYSAEQYFKALKDEMANAETSINAFTDNAKNKMNAFGQFFIDSAQEVANGLNTTITAFQNGEISATEYIEGYTQIADTLSSFADVLQANYSAWSESGEAMNSGVSDYIDGIQSDLNTAINTINQYKDSVMSIELLMNGKVEEGSEEFDAHINTIAQDISNIIDSGGLMAEQLKERLGTTTSEIASNLTQSVSNQSLAAQAIAENTNASITQMAQATAGLFEQIGAAISNFKVDLSFDIVGMQTISFGKILGKEIGTIQIPAKISVSGSGSGFQAIGNALTTYGQQLGKSIAAQQIDFGKLVNFKGVKEEANKTTDALDKLANKYNKLNKAAKGGGGGGGAKKAAEETKDALQELSSALDEVQSAYQTLMDIQESYNENGYITVDQMQTLMQMDLRYLAMLNTEGDAVSVNEQAFQSLTQAKLEEMQVALARQTLDLINSFTSEAVAVEYLAGAYGNLAANALTAAEAALYAAAATQQAKGGAIAQATGLAMQGYENAKNMMGHVNYGAGAGKNSTKSSTGKTKEEEEAEKKKKEQEALKAEMEAELQLKTVDWTERLFEKLEKTIDKWTRSIERMFSYWSKNWATDKAIKNIEEERSQQWAAYRLYMKQAKKAAEKAGMSVEVTEAGDPYFAGGYSLDKKYQKLIANGAMKIEDDVDPVTYEKIMAYQEWLVA